MSSDRPETSAPSISIEPVAVNVGHESSSEPQKDYVPNVFDLVFPTGRARDITTSAIPPEFLQSDAVDSSLLIGSGASFTVTRQALPPGPDKITVRVDMDGWTVDQVTNAPKRPQYIVYKSARVRFLDNGDPATSVDSRALLSVLTEIHALLHPPLHNHPNIITLLGLAWGSNHADPIHRLPVLVVEYGDKGTLADFQSRSSVQTKVVKVSMCRGIAYGLQALHKQGIIHGDMKPENIILCSDQNGEIIPKLADFGFAIIEPSETAPRYIGGSRIWRAPESSTLIPVDKLRSADIYSFGLVVWSIAMQDNNPFRLVLPTFTSQEAMFAEIDRLKASDQILTVSRYENWSLLWMLNFYSVRQKPETEKAHQMMLFCRQQLTTFKQIPIHQRSGVYPGLKVFPNLLDRVASIFPQHLDDIFNCTLTRDPDLRNLEAAIEFLQDQQVDIHPKLNIPELQPSEETNSHLGDADQNKTQHVLGNHPSVDADQTSTKWVATNTSNTTKTFRRFPIRKKQPEIAGQATEETKCVQPPIDWVKLGFKFHRFSWQVIRDLEPGVQRFVVNSLLHLDDASAMFYLSASLMNGYGIAIDLQRVVDSMVEAANRGHLFSRANLHRISSVCGKPLRSDVPVLAYLKQAVLVGSRPALLDLCRLDPEAGKHHWEMLRSGRGGVGADWYAEDQWHHGLNQGSFLDPDFDIETLGARHVLSKLVVNRRGDHIIHAAAAVGAQGLLKTLLADRTLDINQQNSQGETAILCACRSGHPDVVLLLLNNGADASISALNGETPLHWLSSFEPSVNVAMLGKDLIERGRAKVDAFTTERVSHSPVFKTVDVDFQMPGTPLSWAVHDNNQKAVAFLLSEGADPNWCLRDSEASPLQWAAFYHHFECLKLLVEHLEKIEDVPKDIKGNRDLRHVTGFGLLVQYAIHASDNFSMTLRNGPACLYMLKSTLLYLQEKTALITHKLDSDDTLLHYATREGHAEAIRFILEHNWLIHEMNTPAGRYGRTAILESVRWNHVSLFRALLKHGGDPKILSASPYDESAPDRFWSALHLFADQAHNDDMTLVDELVAAGVPVDGDRSHNIETPLNVSIRRNAFKLADHLQSKGASLETRTQRSSLLLSSRMLTILGHTIALNSRYCFDSLRYLLKAGANFLVCPEQGLTALHMCALVPEGLTYLDGTPLKRAEFDVGTNRMITNTILQHFSSHNQLNQRLSNIVPDSLLPKIEEELGDVAGTREFLAENGQTALHLAVEVGNLQVVELLIDAGADKELVCFNETLRFETAADIAERIWSERHPEVFSKLVDLLGE